MGMNKTDHNLCSDGIYILGKQMIRYISKVGKPDSAATLFPITQARGDTGHLVLGGTVKMGRSGWILNVS